MVFSFMCSFDFVVSLPLAINEKERSKCSFKLRSFQRCLRVQNCFGW